MIAPRAILCTSCDGVPHREGQPSRDPTAPYVKFVCPDCITMPGMEACAVCGEQPAIMRDGRGFVCASCGRGLACGHQVDRLMDGERMQSGRLLFRCPPPCNRRYEMDRSGQLHDHDDPDRTLVVRHGGDLASALTSESLTGAGR